MLYHCVLVNKHGVQEENFFREGESAESVLEGLEMFQWANGKWRISPADADADEDECEDE